MQSVHDHSEWMHEHHYAHGHERESERRTLWVVMLTGVMMIVEIAAGWMFNSMALLADGWHMATHTLALGIGAYAYRYARVHAHNPAYTFGTGKVHALAGYTSALFLAVVAISVLAESLNGIYNPKPIQYNEALWVAVAGLCVNLASVWLLHGGEGHHHSHDHDHDDHDHDHGHAHDINRKAAYAHVIVDAMTSVFAIVALLVGKYFGLAMVDPIVGVVGALIIGKWAHGLLRTASVMLLDRQPAGEMQEQVRTLLEADGDTHVTDLHVWQVAPGKLAAIISLVSHNNNDLQEYRERLKPLELVHVTIERNSCAA